MNYLKSIALIVAVSMFGSLLQHSIAHTNLAMLYILVVVITAVRWGRGPSLVDAILSVLILDFFFVPPHFSLTVADSQYLITFATLFIVGTVISTLTLKAREQADKIQQANLLREAEKLHTAFLNSVSHDLRTPLASISGSLSSILQNDALAEETKKSLIETSYEESEKLNQLVGDLLDMARVDAGALHINRKPVDVRDLIGTALKQMEKTLKGYKVSVDIPDNLPEIEIDFVFVMKVLTNILDNAAKYSQTKQEIDITAGIIENFLEIKIADSGIGIPGTDLEHVFDKFYRVKRPQGYKGTGLGLSVCKGIVEAHGGKICAENRKGIGTVIRITLPCTGK